MARGKNNDALEKLAPLLEFPERLVVQREDDEGEKSLYFGSVRVEGLDIDAIGETVAEYKLVRRYRVRRAIVEVK